MTTKQSASEAKKNETKSQTTTPQTKKERSSASDNRTVKGTTPEFLVQTESTKGTTSPVALLITHIKEDQQILKTCDQKIDKAKSEKKQVADRIKEYRKDAYHLFKFATPTEQEQLKKLGFDMESGQSKLNPIAEKTMEILTKSKQKMTCEQLYDAYVSGIKPSEELLSYTQFNIKIRSLFRSQRLIQQKVDETNNTRNNIVYINGFDYKK